MHLGWDLAQCCAACNLEPVSKHACDPEGHLVSVRQSLHTPQSPCCGLGFSLDAECSPPKAHVLKARSLESHGTSNQLCRQGIQEGIGLGH